MVHLRALVPALLLLAACHPSWTRPRPSTDELEPSGIGGPSWNSAEAETVESGEAAAATAPWTPPVAWDTCDRPGFEVLIAALDAATPTDLAPSSVADLAAVANDPERYERALRAALLLATVDHADADAALVDLLERRELRPGRPADAALCLAAARLGRSPFAADLDLVPRLEALCLDGTPHPDLEVRVECARSALLLGSSEPADFLLRVLRLGTRLGLERDGAWRDATTTTWSRNRAAEALAEHLGVASPYHGDAPLAGREQGALELERLLEAARE